MSKPLLTWKQLEDRLNELIQFEWGRYRKGERKALYRYEAYQNLHVELFGETLNDKEEFAGGDPKASAP